MATKAEFDEAVEFLRERYKKWKAEAAADARRCCDTGHRPVGAEGVKHFEVLLKHLDTAECNIWCNDCSSLVKNCDESSFTSIDWREKYQKFAYIVKFDDVLKRDCETCVLYKRCNIKEMCRPTKFEYLREQDYRYWTPDLKKDK